MLPVRLRRTTISTLIQRCTESPSQYIKARETKGIRTAVEERNDHRLQIT